MYTPEQVNELLRQMTDQSVLLSEAIARLAGLSSADLEVLGALEQNGPMIAGQLGELTGLSAAAVTGLIDRLERAGVAARRPDTEDRRRVLVELAPGAAAVAELCGALETDALKILRRRDPDELAVIGEYLRDMYEMGVKHTARMQRSANPPRG
jgi:DNA-binding MarR family transcriptional regulator